jgi:hypothetical protein
VNPDQLRTWGTPAATGDRAAGSFATFDGKPLYTFKLDTSSGMTKGDGLTDDFDATTFDWHAATVDGVSSESPDTGGGGGPRYDY